MKQLNQMDKDFGYKPRLNVVEFLGGIDQKKENQMKQERLNKLQRASEKRFTLKVKRKKKSTLKVGEPTDEQLWKQMEKILDSPKAKSGMKHFSTMTAEEAEVLSDKREIRDGFCQTDNLISEEMQVNTIKRQTGVDQQTQIMEEDPDLVNFDEVLEGQSR